MNQVRPEGQWSRYAAAVFVAFGASVLTALAFALIGVSSRMTSDSSPKLSVVFAICFNLLIGFNGVFLGALCLRHCDRPVGAVVLLALGLAFEVLMLGPAHGEFHFPRGAISTGLGGLVAAAICYWRRQPNEVTSADGGIAAPTVPDSVARR